MAIKTTAEQIEAVQDAIAKAEAGQSWSQDGVSYSRASLDVLYKREQMLLRRYARETGNRPFVSTAFTAGGASTYGT